MYAFIKGFGLNQYTGSINSSELRTTTKCEPSLGELSKISEEKMSEHLLLLAQQLISKAIWVRHNILQPLRGSCADISENNVCI